MIHIKLEFYAENNSYCTYQLKSCLYIFLSTITHTCYTEVSLIMVVRVSLESRHSIRDADIEFQKSVKPVRVYYIY